MTVGVMEYRRRALLVDMGFDVGATATLLLEAAARTKLCDDNSRNALEVDRYFRLYRLSGRKNASDMLSKPSEVFRSQYRTA